MTKTNAMRLLANSKVEYEVFEYEYDENDLAGTHAADFLKIPYSSFYKTLVLKGSKNGIFVCCIAVDKELDLKKAAAAFKDKSCEMIPMKELLPLTGYIRGGCCPIGMKKHFPTYFHYTAEQFDHIYVSAGQRGLQIKVAPTDLIRESRGEIADLI